jgi:putative addiction module component (TIGR02574 family)
VSATEIVEQFRKLPFAEKQEVLERLRDEFDDRLTPEQIAELERRAEEFRKNPQAGIPWEQVRDEARKRLARK